MERFPDELVLRKLNGKKWEVVERFRYHSTRLGKWITVPAGFETDLASVPWFARWYVSRDGDHTKPAMVHDFLYVKASEAEFPDVTREQADRVFLEAMTIRGVRQRRVMYAAVRIGGGKTFRND